MSLYDGPAVSRIAGPLQAAEAPTTLIGQINIQLINKVLALPEKALDTYIKEGKLPAESYLSDLGSVGCDISTEE